MSAQPAPPGPIECLQRGLRSLRANWPLVPLLWAQTLLTLGLALAGLLILLVALGVGVAGWLRELGPGWQRQVVEDLATSLEAGLPAWSPLVLPLLAASLVWTLAFVVYCYLQGGVMGVVAEGEMAAGAGASDWRSFRVFSWARFDRQGRRLFWRYFWLNHLIAAVLLVWAVLLAVLVGFAARLAAGPGTGTGVAVGCVGLPPVMLLLVLIAVWLMLATVELARPGAGVWAASGRALSQLRRRCVPLLVVGLLAVAGGLIVGAVFEPLDWWIAAAAGDRISVWLGGLGVSLLARSLAGHALAVALIATLAALVGLRPAVEAEVDR